MRVIIHPDTQQYYDRTTLESAIQHAKETIEDWDYHRDPHGYCHVRPMLVRLVEALTDEEKEVDEEHQSFIDDLEYGDGHLIVRKKEDDGPSTDHCR